MAKRILQIKLQTQEGSHLSVLWGSCKSRFRLQLLLLYALNLCIDMPKILNAEVCLLNSLDGLQRQASPISDASKAVKMLAVKMLLKLRLLYQHYARLTPMENSR